MRPTRSKEIVEFTIVDDVDRAVVFGNPFNETSTV
jgi:hypothetical protein